MLKHEIERKRLNERIRSISDVDLRGELRSYRYEINKRENILARGARAVVLPVPASGKALKGNRSLRAHDELELLHAFLDKHNVPSCDFFVQY